MDQRKRVRSGVVVASAVVVLIVIAAGIGYGIYRHSQAANVLPIGIKRQLKFSPLVLSGNKSYQVKNYKYDPAEQLLSFVVVDNGGTEIATISQQSLPPQFTEISGFKDQFLQNVAQQYATVQSSNGTVYLAHPPKQADKQIAIIADRGLLVFMNPNQTLSDDQWRKLADSLDIQKIL